MKFDCAKRKDKASARLQRRYDAAVQWHDHFCWWPVNLSYNDCRWLETVQVRYTPWFYNSHELLDEFKAWDDCPDCRR